VNPAGVLPDYPQVSPDKKRGEPVKNIPLLRSSRDTVTRAIEWIGGKPLPEFPASYEFNKTYNHHFLPLAERGAPEGYRRRSWRSLIKTGQIPSPCSCIQVTDQEVMA
jgi:hypothetical protein